MPVGLGGVYREAAGSTKSYGSVQVSSTCNDVSSTTAVAAAMLAGNARHQQLSPISWNVRDTLRKYFQEEVPLPKEAD